MIPAFSLFGLGEVFVEAFNAIGDFFLWAIETSINGWFLILETAVAAALAILPSLPSEPEAPAFIEDINWFFPIGSVIAIGVTALGLFLTFLTVRFILGLLKLI